MCCPSPFDASIEPSERTAVMSATIVDLFEEVLEVPFEDRFISNLDAPILRKLAFRVRDFYTQYELPPKNVNELRPICFPALQRSPKLGATTTLIRGTLNTEHTILILLLSAMLHQRSRSTSYIVTVSASMTLFPGCLTIFWRTIRMPNLGFRQ